MLGAPDIFERFVTLPELVPAGTGPRPPDRGDGAFSRLPMDQNRLPTAAPFRRLAVSLHKYLRVLERSQPAGPRRA